MPKPERKNWNCMRDIPTWVCIMYYCNTYVQCIMYLFYIAIQRSAPFVRRIADISLSLSFHSSILHFVPFALLLLLRRDFIGLFQLFGTYFIFMQIFYSVLYRIDFDRFVYVFFMCQPYSLFISFLFSSPLCPSLFIFISVYSELIRTHFVFRFRIVSFLGHTRLPCVFSSLQVFILKCCFFSSRLATTASVNEWEGASTKKENERNTTTCK